MKEYLENGEIKEGLFFLGINAEKLVNNVLNQSKDKITKGMSENELKAFDFGIKTVISLFDDLNRDKDVDFVVLTDDEIPTEHDVKELEDISKKGE